MLTFKFVLHKETSYKLAKLTGKPFRAEPMPRAFADPRYFVLVDPRVARRPQPPFFTVGLTPTNKLLTLNGIIGIYAYSEVLEQGPPTLAANWDHLEF